MPKTLVGTLVAHIRTDVREDKKENPAKVFWCFDPLVLRAGPKASEGDPAGHIVQIIQRAAETKYTAPSWANGGSGVGKR